MNSVSNLHSSPEVYASQVNQANKQEEDWPAPPPPIREEQAFPLSNQPVLGHLDRMMTEFQVLKNKTLVASQTQSLPRQIPPSAPFYGTVKG